MQAFGLEDRGFRRTGAEDSARICRSSVIRSPKIVLRYVTSASRTGRSSALPTAVSAAAAMGSAETGKSPAAYRSVSSANRRAARIESAKERFSNPRGD